MEKKDSRRLWRQKKELEKKRARKRIAWGEVLLCGNKPVIPAWDEDTEKNGLSVDVVKKN